MEKLVCKSVNELKVGDIIPKNNKDLEEGDEVFVFTGEVNNFSKDNVMDYITALTMQKEIKDCFKISVSHQKYYDVFFGNTSESIICWYENDSKVVYRK